MLVPSPETARAARPAEAMFDVPADQRRVYDLSRDGVLRSIEDSLERLGVDRIDIVYMHDPDDHWEAASTTGAQALVRAARRRRHPRVRRGDEPGRDARRPHRADRRRHRHVRRAASRCSNRIDAERMLRLAAERNVAVVAAAVYNSGLLSRDHVPDDAHFDYGRSARRHPRPRARHRADLPRARRLAARRRGAVPAAAPAGRVGGRRHARRRPGPRDRGPSHRPPPRRAVACPRRRRPHRDPEVS